MMPGAGFAAGEAPRFDPRVKEDLLTIQFEVGLPRGASTLAWRVVAASAPAAEEKWTAVPPPAEQSDDRLLVEIPRPEAEWRGIELRAGDPAAPVSGVVMLPPAERFTLLTHDAMTTLPESERAAWMKWLDRSRRRRAEAVRVLAAECRPLGLRVATPAPGGGESLKFDADDKAEWFKSREAGDLATAVISFQTPAGGWSKSVDHAKGPRRSGMHWTSQRDDGGGWHYCGTLDNRATTGPIEFLAAVHEATGRPDAAGAALKGIRWLLEAQFPNGGWPQNYPLEAGYHEAITLNDDAMVHAMEVLGAVAEGAPPFSWVDGEVRNAAHTAVSRGIDCLAAMQVRKDGTPTVWCAQHHPITLAPVAARKMEPASLSGAESAGVIKFLMRSGPLEPRVSAIIEPAIAWFAAHRIEGLRKTRNAAGRTDYVPDQNAKEFYWARFHDLATGKPIFSGAEDGVIYHSFTEMAARNKVGYDYFTTRPRDLLGKEAARWRKRWADGTRERGRERTN